MTATNAASAPVAIPAPPSQALVSTQLLDGEIDYMAEVRRVKKMTEAIHALMRDVMKEGEHYGVIPGTEKTDPKTGADISKPTLYQPGADLLCMVFRLRPEFEEISVIERDDFIAKTIRCNLIHIPTGVCFAQGIGSSNSREAKYASQTNVKVCPECNAKTIFKSKRDPGWFCWKNKGGCGQTFAPEDPAIVDQGSVADTNGVWTNHNNITKIGNKRAKASAVMTATGAGSVFDIDREDEAPDSGQVMSPQQWNVILGEQKRLGISGNDFHARFIAGVCGKEKIAELTFNDAVAIMAELKKAPASVKPTNLDDAAARAKAAREAKPASSAAAVNGKSAPSEADRRVAEEKAFGAARSPGAAAGAPAARAAAPAASTVTPAAVPAAVPADARPKLATQEQKRDLAYLSADKGVLLSEIVERHGVASTAGLPFEAAEAELKALREMPDVGGDEPGSAG